MTTREGVIKEAETWLLTPWHHRAMVKGAGVDCALFLYAVYTAVGLVPKFPVESYPPDFMLHRGEEKFLSYVTQYAHEVADPLPADLAMYKVGHSFSHGAIVVAWPKIIHAQVDHGVIYDEGDLGRLGAKKRSFWRLNLWKDK